MSDTPLSWLSATDLLRLYRDRKISPVEVVSDLLARIPDSAASLNAICFTYGDEALDEARKSEARYPTFPKCPAA